MKFLIELRFDGLHGHTESSEALLREMFELLLNITEKRLSLFHTQTFKNDIVGTLNWKKTLV